MSRHRQLTAWLYAMLLCAVPVRALAAGSAVPPQLYTTAAHYLLLAGKDSDAQASMALALVAEKRAHGAASLEVATALSRLALLHAVRSHDPHAMKLYTHALRIRERQLGPNALGVAKSLENIARMRFALGTSCCDLDPRKQKSSERNTPIARKLIIRASRIRELRLGLDHPDIAQEQFNLATYDAAKNQIHLYQKALAVREKAFGLDSLPVAESLLKLADVAQQIWQATNMGHPSIKDCEEHRLIEAMRQRALAIREKILGNDAPELTNVLESLADDTCRVPGEADQRLAIRSRILSIDEKAAAGQTSKEVSWDLKRIADLLDAPDQAEEKRTLELRAAHIDESDALMRLTQKHRMFCRQSHIWWLDDCELFEKFDDEADLAKIEVVQDGILSEGTDHQVMKSISNPKRDLDIVSQHYERLGDLASAERALRESQNDFRLADFFARHGQAQETTP